MADTARRGVSDTKIDKRDPRDCMGETCMFDCFANMSSHAHAHSHSHRHEESHARAHSHTHGGNYLKTVLIITAAFMLIELVGGLVSNSLALIADAAHMLTDVAALGLSMFVLWYSRRPARPERSFGNLRVEILAALVNGVTLVVIAIAIFWQAYQRLRTPEPVEGGLMMGVAFAGLVVNIIAARLLHSSAHDNLNLRGAYLHVLGDLVGSVGAIVAAIIILLTGYTLADPAISVLVGLLILLSSWKLVRESVDVLLESTPAHINLGELRDAIDAVPGVDNVHDLHVWTVTSGYLAMSGHAVVRSTGESQRILRDIHQRMHDGFGIHHVTMQLECES